MKQTTTLTTIMKILMISIDKGLLGRGQLGDVVERHKKYGQFCDALDVIVLSSAGYEANKISDKVRVYPTNSKSPLSYYKDGKKVGQKLLAENKYDLIISQTPFIAGMVARQLAQKSKAKLLVHFHGDFWQNSKWLLEKWWRNWFLLLLAKFLVVPSADAIRVMSVGQKEKFSEKIQKKVEVISTPVNLKKYEIQNSKFKIQNSNIVLHVGRDDKVKDFETLIKAFKIIKKQKPEIKFWQVGVENNQILKNSGIELKGPKTHQELIDIYYQSSMVVLSSKSESFGKVLVEANACGKPVVSTATTGAKEIVKDGINGYLVPVGDAEKLADKILYLLNNPDIAKKMGEAGRELVREKFGDNTEKIIEFWREII